MTQRPERPEFASSIRGYDRLQVDDYIDRLVEIVVDAEERAQSAERELEFSRHTTVGPRVGHIMEMAVDEAKELRERVAAETEEMRSNARQECEQMNKRAQRAAAETHAKAKRSAKQLITQADAIRDQILGEVEALSEQKAAFLGDLERLQEALGVAAREAMAGTPDEGASGERPRPEASEDEPAESRSPKAERQGEREPGRAGAAR
jgi:cell division septum initiation protein DivIVA